MPTAPTNRGHLQAIKKLARSLTEDLQLNVGGRDESLHTKVTVASGGSRGGGMGQFFLYYYESNNNGEVAKIF